MASWNPFQKKAALISAPLLNQGFSTVLEDRDLLIAFKNLQTLEENTKRLHKEVKRYEECMTALQEVELALSSELFNSPIVHDDSILRKSSESYQSAVFQMFSNVKEVNHLCQVTVADPLKKLVPEFGAIANAVKKRDAALSECTAAKGRLDKLEKLEKTGTNVVKAEQARRALKAAEEEFKSQNRVLSLELPQFHENSKDYLQPCLQALVRSQVNYYGEVNSLFTQLVNRQRPENLKLADNNNGSSSASALKEEAGPAGEGSSLDANNKIAPNPDFSEESDRLLSNIRSLSIVGS